MTIHKSEEYIECDACKCKVATVHKSWLRRKDISVHTSYVEFSGNSTVPDTSRHMSVYVKFPLHLCHRCYSHLLNTIKDKKEDSDE